MCKGRRCLPHPAGPAGSRVPCGEPSCLSGDHCLPFPQPLGSAWGERSGSPRSLTVLSSRQSCCFRCSLSLFTVFLNDYFLEMFMVLIFISSVSNFYSRCFFINFTCQEKKSNQILLYYHIFIKLNHLSYMLLSICLFLLSTQSKGGNSGWFFLVAGRC